MATFNSSEWIGKKLKYTSSLPRYVRRAATQALRIPDVVQAELDAHNSLQGLITFSLPPQVAAEHADDLVGKYFSFAPPSSSAALLPIQLRRLAILDPKTVNKLVDAARQAWLNGAQSVLYAHLAGDGNTTTHFPLGVVSWWKAVTDRREPRARWLHAKAFLQKQQGQAKHPEREIVATEAAAYMTTLPWNVKQDISDNAPTHRLSRFFGPHYLSTSELNSKLLLLGERAVLDAGLHSGVRFEPVEATNYILHAYDHRDDPNLTLNSLIAGIQDSIYDGKLALTIAHLEKVNDTPHWVATGINGATNELLYGDSLGGEIPARLANALRWFWGMKSETLLELKYLDITLQTDGYNCGILAANALEHYVFNTPLAGNQVRDLAMRRLQDFLELAERIVTKRQFSSYDEVPTHSDSDSEFSTDDEGLEYLLEHEIEMPSGEFTFRFPLPSKEKDNTPVVPALKRSRDHPHVPTPNPSPEKKRVHVEGDASIPLPPLQFTAATVNNDIDDDFEDMPVLKPVDADDEEEDDDDDDDEEPVQRAASPRPSSPPGRPLRAQSITNFFSKETPQERAERNQRNAEQAALDRDERQARHNAAQLRKKEKEREAARLRKEKSRRQKRAEKVAEGWVPYANKRKRQLKQFDDSDDSGSITDDDHSLAELSRPRRQFKEDAKESNKNCGRKRQKVKKDAERTNWTHPILWSQIETAAKRAGKPWRPSEILRELRKANPKDFADLNEQTIGRWIDPVAKRRGESQWRESILKRAKKGNRPGGETRRTGILSKYPELCAAINKRLSSLRQNGVALTLTTIRAIMVSYINVHAPHLFTTKQPDGTIFCCSESFARKYLRNTLGWSERRATKVAKKVPENVDEVLTEAFLREAYITRDHAIPDALRVNTDQTQIVYQQGTKTTWNEKNAKQVPTVGLEEKRAFTLVPSISASGEVLPLQAIFQGKTDTSCPSPKSPHYDDAMELGMRFVPSKTDTYWSTHETMHDLVDNIIAPYFDKKKKELGLDVSQCSLWKIDCWSVHKSKEFRAWMKKHHPNIIVLFVPGNCTSLWQPLDVGIQRVMKLSIKRACHRDVVKEIGDQLNEDPEASATVDTSIKTLRNRSVGWLVNCVRDISDKEFVQKAFQLCVVGELNCSQACLTSPSTLAMLRNLRETHPVLHAELVQGNISGNDETVETDMFPNGEDDGVDDSDIPLHALADALDGNVPAGFVVSSDGRMERVGVAEGDDDSLVGMGGDDNVPEPVVELAKRTRSGRAPKPSRWYSGDVWERS